ncbi:hypothetical protein CR513_05454, partial [Mucuna pruriens]
MVTIFIDTLSSPYYNKVVGRFASNFADLVVVGERIELGIRHGKLAQANSNGGLAKKLPPEKKKGEANAVLIEPVFPYGKETVPLYPVQFHVEAGVANVILPLKPLVPSYPRSYDPKARCDYHGRVVGHTTERCWGLKHKVQDLLDGGLLGF